MTFTEWYKQKYDDEWHEDYAGLYLFTFEMTEEYDVWCKENKIDPKWNC